MAKRTIIETIKEAVAPASKNPEGPVFFHKLKESEQKEVLKKLGKGECVLRGPNSEVIYTK